MDWPAWAPTYRAILDDFGYSRADDGASRDALAARGAWCASADLEALAARVRGREVIVAGPRPSPLPEGPVFATDAASWAFERASCIVTDLDGDVDAQVAANARGVPVFLHAHGDNGPALARHAGRFGGPVQATTQAEPRGPVRNFGGFTDGDRACCLAVHLGANALALAGFDFDEPWPKPGGDAATKKRKLAWARRIVDGLGVPVRAV